MTRKRDHWKLAHAELKRGIEGLFEVRSSLLPLLLTFAVIRRGASNQYVLPPLLDHD